MKKPYKDILDFVVKKSTVVILGVQFVLSDVSADVSAASIPDCSFESVDSIEEVMPVKTSIGCLDFELTDNQNKWEIILDELSEYSDNWDGEGARAINPATIDNCRVIVKDTARYESLLDDIFPTAFGTVCLQWYKPSTDALVNAEIAPDKMAFYADEPGRDLYNLPPMAFGKEAIHKLISALESLS